MNILSTFLLLMCCLTVYAPVQALTRFIFAHGLGGDDEQITWYKSGNNTSWSILPATSISFNFPEAEFKHVQGKRIKLPLDNNKVNLAQEGDIQALTAIYKQVKQESPESKIVLMGMSRGASAIITFVATQQPTGIKALVLEAPFDTLETILTQLKKKYEHASAAEQAAIARQWNFPNYNKQGIKPINVVNKINKHIPILLIHSRQDTLIPFESSKALYTKLRQSGHKHVYLLELYYGEHARYQFSKSALTYQQVVNAFYKKYGIPHDPELARKGKKLFESLAVTKSIHNNNEHVPA